MDRWFYKHRKGELGPLSAVELRYMASIGTIRTDTMIRKVGSVDWIQYGHSEVTIKPIRATSKLIQLTSVQAASPRTADEPQKAVSVPTMAAETTGATQPEPKIHSLTVEERRARMFSGALVAAVLVMAALLILLWPRPLEPSGSAGTQGVASGGNVGPGGSVGNADTAGEIASAGAAESGASPSETAPEPTATTEKDEAEESAASTMTEVPSEEMADVEPPEATTSESPTPATIVEVDPERRPRDAKYGITLPKKKSRAGKQTPIRPTQAELQQSDLTARSGKERQQAIDEGGGTIESEQAVALALQWLRKLQQPEGSWDFRIVGENARPGTLDGNLGATALATLCFLGVGNTTRSGPDKDVVKRAFEYIKSQKGRSQLGQHSMYVHGLVTLCLTELATLEPDEADVRKLATEAVRFIETAQDPQGGGWRYRPLEPGDTSVTGWQIMALQSAKTAGILVDQQVVNKAHQFLDSVSDYDGGHYQYTPGSPATACMTSVGLLCRMYLGWNHNNAHLQRGIEHLVTVGVSPIDIYYNYYATIAMHHSGGEPWTTWNAQMREQLIQTQIKSGPAAGSWIVTDPHGGSAGQIYQTTLSVLTLEVYYRYLPLYQNTKASSAESVGGN